MIIRFIIVLLSIIASVWSATVIEFDSYFKMNLPILIFILTFVGLYALYFLGLYILSLTISKNKEYEKQNRFMRFLLDQTLNILCFFSGARIQVNGLDKVPEDKQFVLVYNHKSNFDPMILSVVLKKKDLIHISKPGNFNIPIAGRMVKRNCYLSINREDAREAYKTINKAASYIKDNKFSIGVSPEGTRNRTDEPLLEFRDGCFKIALLSKAPIVVCCLHNTADIVKNFPFKRTTIEVNFLDVIEYDENMKTVDISKIVRKDMIEDLSKKEECEKEIYSI